MARTVPGAQPLLLRLPKFREDNRFQLAFGCRGSSNTPSCTRTPLSGPLTQASLCIAIAASAKLKDAHNRRVTGKDWEVIKAAIAEYIAAEKVGPGTGLEHALWFVYAVARSRAAKARRRTTRGRLPVVADRYFHSVRVALIRGGGGVGLFFHEREKGGVEVCFGCGVIVKPFGIVLSLFCVVEMALDAHGPP